jgi:VWFA-related protein
MLDETPGGEGRPDVPKIQALKEAASRFVDIMRTRAQTSLLPFSNTPEKASPFTSDKNLLKQGIRRLEAQGETALFQATYNGVLTLNSARQPGKRALVVLTDGRDSNSRPVRAEDAIREAQAAQIPLHMLGLGKDGDIDADIMKEMARESKGSFHHVKSSHELVRIFEELSIELHDDGIDEKTLKELAEQTGGKYYPARDVGQLKVTFQEVVQELQSTFTVTYVNPRQVNDGTIRKIEVNIERQGQLIATGQGSHARPGVLFPEMETGVYLLLLGILAAVLLIPGGLRALWKGSTRTS